VSRGGKNESDDVVHDFCRDANSLFHLNGGENRIISAYYTSKRRYLQGLGKYLPTDLNRAVHKYLKSACRLVKLGEAHNFSYTRQARSFSLSVHTPFLRSPESTFEVLCAHLRTSITIMHRHTSASNFIAGHKNVESSAVCHTRKPRYCRQILYFFGRLEIFADLENAQVLGCAFPSTYRRSLRLSLQCSRSWRT
jgi:hypothetical protein